jgi:hypothetical protein
MKKNSLIASAALAAIALSALPRWRKLRFRTFRRTTGLMQPLTN